MSYFQRFWFSPIDASFLAVFRIMFGMLLLFESVNYGIFLCLDCLFRSSDMLFKYSGFEWVGLWPGAGLELTFLAMGVSALGVVLGLFYRCSMLICSLCLCYLFFLDQSLYLNHFYLALLFCFIMVFMPANRVWSLDARRIKSASSATVPAWTRFWLIAQLEIVLIYAGLVKINLDWLNLEPMRLWMNSRSHDAHPVFQWLTQDFGIATASYGVIILHIVGAPLLLWRKTRLWIFFVYCFFHLTNAMVFNIGIFPWMTIAATLVFFDPDWPRQFYHWLRAKRGYTKNTGRDTSKSTENHKTDWSGTRFANSKAGGVLIVLFICSWLIVQLLMPLRHWTMPGNVAWNEAGHRYSWRMKLRDKRGRAQFYVVKNGQDAIMVEPSAHLNRRQAQRTSCNPDLIWQFAQFLKSEYTGVSNDSVKVFVDANCSLNTRELAPLINRLVDIASIPRGEPVQNWVLPNTKPLPKTYLPI